VTSPDRTPQATGPLKGLRVLEIAQLIAGPLAGTFLADYGAEVIHIEAPDHGDPARYTGHAKDGTYLWWKVAGRNKRSITLDLRVPAGQELARKVAAWADVVITNFRPGTLVKWGLDWQTLHRGNPKLIMLQISGFGLNTTLQERPGFGKVGEAMSGVVHLTGFPDGPPVHTGFSHADSVTAITGAFAVQAALYRRSVDENFDGELIDLALFESLFRLIEWQVVLYDQLGIAAERAGNRLASAPAAVINMYLAKNNEWVTVTTGTWRSVQKVASLLGEPPEDYDTPEKQTARRDRLDELLHEYVGARTAQETVGEMIAAGVVASTVFSMREIMTDPTYDEREDIITIEDEDLGPLRMQGVVPRMHNHPGRVWRTGAKLGADNDLVFKEILNLSDDEIAALRSAGVT
jgi:formyl-CoA transferase